MPTPDSGPFGIAAGPDDALWFTEMNTDIIGRVTTSGVITEFPLPVKGGFPSMITVGSGNRHGRSPRTVTAMNYFGR